MTYIHIHTQVFVSWLSSPVAEVTDGGLKCFIVVSVKVRGLEGLGCWSSTTIEEVGCPLGRCCPLAATCHGVSEICKMYSLAAGAGCCDC